MAMPIEPLSFSFRMRNACKNKNINKKDVGPRLNLFIVLHLWTCMSCFISLSLCLSVSASVALSLNELLEL